MTQVKKLITEKSFVSFLNTRTQSRNFTNICWYAPPAVGKSYYRSKMLMAGFSVLDTDDFIVQMQHDGTWNDEPLDGESAVAWSFSRHAMLRNMVVTNLHGTFLKFCAKMGYFIIGVLPSKKVYLERLKSRKMDKKWETMFEGWFDDVVSKKDDLSKDSDFRWVNLWLEDFELPVAYTSNIQNCLSIISLPELSFDIASGHIALDAAASFLLDRPLTLDLVTPFHLTSLFPRFTNSMTKIIDFDVSGDDGAILALLNQSEHLCCIGPEFKFGILKRFKIDKSRYTIYVNNDFHKTGSYTILDLDVLRLDTKSEINKIKCGMRFDLLRYKKHMTNSRCKVITFKAQADAEKPLIKLNKRYDLLIPKKVEYKFFYLTIKGPWCDESKSIDLNNIRELIMSGLVSRSTLSLCNDDLIIGEQLLKNVEPGSTSYTGREIMYLAKAKGMNYFPRFDFGDISWDTMSYNFNRKINIFNGIYPTIGLSQTEWMREVAMRLRKKMNFTKQSAYELRESAALELGYTPTPGSSISGYKGKQILEISGHFFNFLLASMVVDINMDRYLDQVQTNLMIVSGFKKIKAGYYKLRRKGYVLDLRVGQKMTLWHTYDEMIGAVITIGHLLTLAFGQKYTAKIDHLKLLSLMNSKLVAIKKRLKTMKETFPIFSSRRNEISKIERVSDES